MQSNNPKSTLGVDINEYTTNINFDQLKNEVKFVYLRAAGYGTGKLRVDKKFIEFAKECRKRNIPVGAYLYAVPSLNINDAVVQADGFITTLQQGFGKMDFGELFPVLDVEAPLPPKTIPTAALIDWVLAFKKRFENRTGRKLMLYTGEFFVDIYDNFYIPGRGFPLKDMPLWIASYYSVPKNVGGWTKWDIWQYTEKGKLNSIESLVDLNWGPDNIQSITQPSRVTGFGAYFKNPTTITVGWNKSTGYDICGYNLFLDGEFIETFGKNDTFYNINLNKFPKLKGRKSYTVSIAAFTCRGDSSKRVSTVIRR